MARESSTVRFNPRVVESLTPVSDGVAKLVGVSDDFDTVQKAVDAVRDRFGDHVSAARSQPYYADVTHPQANKGAVVSYLSKTYQIPTEEIATIGDQSNDVLMFAHSGLSIAMGNATMRSRRPPVGSPRPTLTRASPTRWSGSSSLAQAADRDRAVLRADRARVGGKHWRFPRTPLRAISAQLCVRLNPGCLERS